MPPQILICVHCGQVLEPLKRGGAGLSRDASDSVEVCRFCQKNFKGKCLQCDNKMPHTHERALQAQR